MSPLLRTCLLSVSIATGTAVSVARAAEWRIDPTISAGVGYNDNIRLDDDDEVSSAEARLDPSVLFGMETARSGLSGDLRFSFRRYEDDSDLDENNSRFLVDSFHRMERTEVGLDLGFIKDTTLDSQLENTGLVFDRVDRQRIDIKPNWSYFFTPGTRLRASYGYADVNYENAANTGFVDFTTNSGDLSLIHLLSERATVTASLSAFHSDNDNDVKTTNINLQNGISYQFSPTLSTSLFAGVRRTETDYSQNSSIPIFSGNTIIALIPVTEDINRSDWGFTYDGNISKSYLRGEATLSASRSVSDDVNGAPIQVDRFTLNNLYNLSETLSFNLELLFYNSQTTNTAGQSLDRNYYQVRPRISWNFKKDWRLSARYRYRKQTFDDTNEDATQNAAYLTLDYLWPRIAISR